MARQTPVNAGYTIINGTSTGSNAASVDCWLEYKITAQSVTGNTSTLDVYLYAAATKSSTTKWAKAEKFGYVQCDGGDKIYRSTTYDFSGNKVNCFGHTAFTVSHKDDGTKTVTLAGAWSTSHSTYISGGSASGSVPLPAIARESEISATEGDIGGVCRIAVTQKSADFSHAIAYRFGTLSGYINEDGQISASQVRHKATDIDFLLPDSFYGQIPNARQGTLTLTCTTYSGTTQVGDEKGCEVTVTAARSSCAPTVSGTVVDVNEKTIALTADASKLVRFMSTALCTITAAAKHSASLTSKSIGGVAVSSNSRRIENVDTATVRFTATDSREYTTEKSVTVSMIPYVLLTNNAKVSRDDPTSGNATITLKGSYFNGSFGATQNSLQVRYRIGSGSWVDAGTAVTFSGNSYTGTVALSGLDYTSAYRVEVEVSDALSTVAKALTVQKGLPVFDWGENDFNFNVPVNPAAGINGAFINTVRVWDAEDTFRVQSRFSSWSGDNGDRQTFFIFGSVGGSSIMYGVARVAGGGACAWAGTGGVTIHTESNGVFAVKMPSGCYDTFLVISPQAFSLQ